MKHLVTGKEMKLLDDTTSSYFHVPSVVLMEQAANAFVQELFTFQKDMKRVLIVCGSGNNGADGIAIARLLNQKGIRAEIYPASDKKSGTELYDLQKKIYDTYGYPYYKNDASDYDVVIDAVFGIGLSREISGSYAEVICLMNDMQGLKVAVDISSGVSADNGSILGTAFRADRTITFSFGKLGQYLWPGSEYSGIVHVVPMGITKESLLGAAATAAVLEPADLKQLLPVRKAHSNKGSYGKVLVIAGARNMAGAAYFSAKAAASCGAGLVKVFTEEGNRTIIQTLVPEAILSVYPAEWNQASEKELADALTWCDTVVIGPGIGKSSTAKRILEITLQTCRKPMVLDADALNLISEDSSMKGLLRENQILTPHLGEMSRLTGNSVSEIQRDLISAASVFSGRHNTTLVLKDFHTVIAAPEKPLWLNLTGNNGMATGGSGDVLSGVIGALLAAGMVPEMAAACGVMIHGLAGDLAAEKKGFHGLTAPDLLEGLGTFWGRNDKTRL